MLGSLRYIMSSSNPDMLVGSRSSWSLSDDDKELEDLGYVPSFKREFSNLATVSGSRTHWLHALIVLVIFSR